MPPKRKLNEDDSMQAMRSTRTRSKTITNNDSAEAGFTRKRKSKSREDHEDLIEHDKKATQIGDQSSQLTDKGQVRGKSSSSPFIETPVNSKSPGTPVEALTNDPSYNPKHVVTLFEAYAEPDEPNIIGPEGFEKLCCDASLSMEGPVPLILAWQMDAKEMAKISKEEWVSGMKDLWISSLNRLAVALTDLEDLLLFGKPPVKKSRLDPYNRTRYWSYVANTKDAFRDFYLYCFMLVKPSSSKNIEMDTAVAFWSVLLGPKYPLMRDVLDFVNEKGTYRAVNKDLWAMMLEFCETINPNLDNFEADGAWPTLLDEFALWKTGKV